MTSKEALDKLYMACDSELLYEQSGIISANELTTIIEQDLNRLEKLEMVIGILEDKGVDVGMLIHLMQCDNDEPDYYNEGLKKEYQLTQEEYELLKGVFEND